MLTRQNDIKATTQGSGQIPLPIIDFSVIKNLKAPTLIPINYQGANAPLPKADIVIITWTTSEWSAFDHVFLNSNSLRYPNDNTWQKNWYVYEENAVNDPTSKYPPLWGYYQMVSITTSSGKTQTVLLFKGNSHLSYSPYITGMNTMIDQIANEAQPSILLSIGTAGGCRYDQYLGDVVITNSGYLDCSAPQNNVPYNHQTFTSKWFPPTNLLQSVAKKLCIQLKTVATVNQLTYMVNELNNQDSTTYTYADLINAQLQPANLNVPHLYPLPKVPLETIDNYYIAATYTSDAQYAILEMDDAAIAHELVTKYPNINFSFVRNVSDTVIAWQDAAGNPIPTNVRTDFSSILYDYFGIYTSYNGALTAWALLAGA